MKILINLVGIMGHDSQERCAIDTLNALLPKLIGHTVDIVAPRHFPKGSVVGSYRSFHQYSGLSNKLYVVFFVQVVLPFIMLRRNSKVIYSPVTSFSVICAKKSIPTIHDLDYLHSKKQGWAEKYIKMLYRYSAIVTPYTFVISETIKKEIVDMYHVTADKFVVIHNGLPALSNEETAIGLPERYFLYIGIYRPRKNIEFMIKAFSAVKDTVPYMLVLAGSVQKEEVHLRVLARSLGCNDRIIFTGYVSDEKKVSLLKHASAVIFPSLYEGFGIPILEAQIVGVPIVLSDIPVFHEIAGNGALFIDPTDTASLSKMYNELALGMDISTVVENGKNNIKRFSWNNTADSISYKINEYGTK